MTSVFLGMPSTAPRGVGNLRGAEPFPAAARRGLGNQQLRHNLGHATSTIRAKSAAVIGELPDWQQLRDAGAAIKAHTMARLPQLLERLEARVTAAGGVVHWARDAVEANDIVIDLVRATGSDQVVKVKSMATQEIGLNEALEAAGIAPIETDLAELIVQLGDDKPSHILVPAIHRNRTEIRDLFRRAMPGVEPALSDEPAALAAAARRYLREAFLTTRVAVSGANFAVAETGTIVLDGSPEQGRRALTLLPDLHVCVVEQARIAGTVPEALGRLTADRPLTWISGPSATSDIEFDRVEGVHGPRRLHVVIVEGMRAALSS